MIYVRTLIALLSLLSLANVYASDWRYTGNTGGKDDSAMFYDADSISYPNKDTVRVWIKLISQKALDKWAQKHSLDKRVIDAVAKKIAYGYSPDYFEIPSVKSQRSTAVPKQEEQRNIEMQIMIEEQLADFGDVKETAKVFDEIQCAERQLGFLSIVMYKSNGEVTSTDTDNPQYHHVAPDTTGEWLLMLVCPKS